MQKALRKHHCLGWWCLTWVIDSPNLISKCFAGVNQIITNVPFVFLFLFEMKCQLGYIHIQVFQSKIEISLDYFIFSIILAYRALPLTQMLSVSQ